MSSLVAYTILVAIVISGGVFLRDQLAEPRNDASDDEADGDCWPFIPEVFPTQHDGGDTL